MMDWNWFDPEDRLRMVKERQGEMRRSAERRLLAMDGRSRPKPRRPLRLALGTGLARLGLRLAGRQAIRAALGEAT
jgi:hypothetical protein